MQLIARKHRWSSQHGLSLVEVLISTAIGLVVLATAGTFGRFQLFALRNQVSQLDLQTGSRSVVDLFAREVRQAGLDPTCAMAFSGVADAGATWLHIQSDLNGNGVIDGANEDVTYTYSTGTIQRTANGATDVLLSAQDLSASTFRYFDATGTELVPSAGALSPAQRANVQRVRIELVVNGAAVDPENSQPLKMSVSSDVDLRNRFFVSGTGCP